MIRRAVSADLPRMVEMGRKFHAYAVICEVSFDAESFRKTLEHGIKSDNQAYFVAEHGGAVVGMTGGVSYPSYFNHSAKAAQEMFWWCEVPGMGRDLYAALEQWAVSQGCKTMTMIALHDGRAERMGKLYERMGYRPTEHCYIKGL